MRIASSGYRGRHLGWSATRQYDTRKPSNPLAARLGSATSAAELSCEMNVPTANAFRALWVCPRKLSRLLFGVRRRRLHHDSRRRSISPLLLPALPNHRGNPRPLVPNIGRTKNYRLTAITGCYCESRLVTSNKALTHCMVTLNASAGVWRWAQIWAQLTASPQTPWRDPSTAESPDGSS